MATGSITTPVAWREVLNRQYASPLLLVCLGVWLHAADGLLVATMMPAIVSGIGGEAYVAWTIALYEIGSIVVGATSALLVLKMGVRRPMSLAAAVFAIGCFISAVAPVMPVLLLGRLLQGVGGGGLTALAFIATALFFPSRLSARVMAAISVLWGASAFLGPLIGGFFVSYLSWRMGFVFFGVQALILVAWMSLGIHITEHPPESGPAKPVPFGRLALLSLGVVMIAYAGINVTPLRTPVLLMLGLVTLMLFLKSDAANATNRLLPENPFSLRDPLGAALLMILAISVATMGLSTYGPLLMTVIHGTPAIVAGYVLAAISIGWSAAAFAVSGAPEHHDRNYIAAGISMVFLSVLGLVYAVASGPIMLIAFFAALEGIGYGTSWTFIIRRAKRLAGPNDVERLTGALPTVSRLGFALGASISGILANAAGFSMTGTADDAAFVARTIFIGNLPFGLLGLLALACFVLAKDDA